MTNADSNHVQQKGQAYKTKSGRDVYSGGGIMPDVFVSVDTSVISRNFARLYTNNTLNNFAYRYFMQHQAELKTIPSAKGFIQINIKTRTTPGTNLPLLPKKTV